MAWLSADFAHPERVELPSGHHLRPIRESDVNLDYPAVMGSRQTLWARFGGTWGWPPADMSYEADRKDLARHAAEIYDHVSFNYAVFNREETELLGCVYIDPPGERAPAGADALVSWWVVDGEAGGNLEQSLNTFVPGWLSQRWGFHAVHYAP